MSVKVEKIPNCSNIQLNKNIVFKKNTISQDKVELKHNKNKLSMPSKIGIGAAVASIIGLGLELTFGKCKHIKSLWERISKVFKNNNAKNKNKITDFKNIREASEYFGNLGIKTELKSGSEKHLTDLNNIKDDLMLLEKNGVAYKKPDSIVLSDWHNNDELKEIFRRLNIDEEFSLFCNNNTWAWGTVTKGTDNKHHVIINTSFSGNYGRFIHEMGHIHQDFINSSYWHSKGLGDREFMQKQLDILGHPEIKLSDNYDTPHSFISSVLRYYNLSDTISEQVKENVFRMFPDLSERDLTKVFCVGDKDGKTYYINAKKMVDKMASESGVYAPDKSWENVAEIFQKLNKGEGDKLSDLVMLMYDINGGGRVPNIKIKGKNYDEYIESLYNNSDLINQLRKMVDVKQII